MGKIATVRQQARAETETKIVEELLRALVKAKGNISEAAAALGYEARTSIYRVAEAAGLDLQRARAALILGETDIGKLEKAARG